MKLAVIIASGLGCGFAPRAPGTVGSLAALAPGAMLCMHPGLLPLGIVLSIAAGLWAIPRASGGADHGWIVIDEVAGQWLTLLGLPALHPPGCPGFGVSMLWLAAAFALFRLLDITKPGPIGAIDRRHDGLGVMGDDVLAGVLGAVILLLARAAATRLWHGTWIA